MNPALIAARVESVWADYCDDRAVQAREDTFLDNGNDSFDQVEFVMDLEEEFGIMISDEEEESVGGMTLDLLTRFIAQKLKT